MRFVAIATSSAVGSAALFDDGEIVAEAAARVSNAHGESLLPMVDSLFARVGWDRSVPYRWAVDVGPGSFTGLRVGLATVKGILLAAGGQLYAVSSLDALGYGLPPDANRDALIVAVLEAGKGEVFVQAKANGRFLLAPSHLRGNEVAFAIRAVAAGRPVVVAGDAATGVDWSALGGAVTVANQPPNDWPRATSVGRLAQGAEPVVDVDALEPLYVRPPEITMPKPRAPAR